MNNRHRNTGKQGLGTWDLGLGKEKQMNQSTSQPVNQSTNLLACPPRRGMVAFTLVELLMAVTITAMIGMAVVAVSSALSSAKASTDSMVEAVSSGRYAMRSIAADVRKAALVTAADDDGMVIWTGDDNGDGQINLDELVLIRPDDEHTVERLQVVFTPAAPASLNISKTLEKVTDVDNIRKLLIDKKYSDYLSRRTLAVDVSNFEVVTDESPPIPQLVLIRLTVGQVPQQITLTNTARLRADATGYVSFEDGKPVLDLGCGDD